MIFGEGPIIKNIAGDLNKLFLQGSRVGQPITNVEGDAAADQGTADLLAAMDPVIQEVAVGMSGEESMQYTVSGTPPLTLTDSLGMPLRSWSVEVSPYQEGTGDPSPQNIRTIHGTDKLTITTTGTNLLPTYTQSVTQNGVTYTANPDGSVTVNGTATATNTHVAPASIWQWDGVSDVWLSGCPAGGDYNNGYSLRIDASGYTGRFSKPDVGSGIKLTPVTPSEPSQINGYPLTFCIVIRAGTICDNLVFRPMLNYGLSALPYQPYVAPSQTVLTLPQTVYTGTIGSEGGESRWASYTATGNEELVQWYLNGASANIAAVIKSIDGNLAYADYADGAMNAMCDMSPQVTNVQMYMRQTDHGVCIMNNRRIAIQVEGVTTLAEMSAWLAENKPTFVYKIATPTTFAVPSVTIPTPTGTATTWATAEDGIVDSMEVTYVGKA